MLLALLLPSLARATTISGTITDEAGDPLAGVEIVAYDERLNYGTATSTNDGSWSMNYLPAGHYRIRAAPGSESAYVDRFYPSEWDYCSGSPVQIIDGTDLTGIDLALPLGGTLSGTLTDLAGTPLSGADVTAEGVDTRTALGTRDAVTDTDGRFQITGLDADAGQPTDWQCSVDLDGFPKQWLGSTYTQADATPFSVALPAEAPTGTDAGANALLDGIRVSGLITGPDGPVTSGTTFVYSPSQVLTTTIGADGTFVADGLPPGDVINWATVPGLATTYWPDSDRPTDARVAAPNEGDDVTADLSMPAESALNLTFTDATGLGDPGAISVLLYNDSHTVGNGGPVAADGTFTISGLWSGSYDLYVYGSDGGFVDGYAVQGAAVDGQTDVTVPLTLGASISGHLSDDAGAGVYGGYVYAFPADSPDTSYTAVADENGDYAVLGLPAGYYTIRASYVNYCPSDRGYVTVWWNDSLTQDFAAPELLSAGQAMDGTDFHLPDDDDHDGMGDAWERANGLDTSRDDSAEDLDGDGFSNLEEYLLGTDPNSPGTGSGIGCKGCATTPDAGWGALVIAGVVMARRRRG